MNEPVTRSQVALMIFEALKQYDEKQDERHQENSNKLDQLKMLIIVTLLSTTGGLIGLIITRLLH